jgi:hypothetical protein
MGQLAGSEADSLKIAGVKITGRDAVAFQVSPDLAGVTVAPGAARDFWIRFSPRHAGPHTATLVISRAPSPPFSDWTIPLTGNGVEERIDCGTASMGALVEVKRPYFGGAWNGALLKVKRVAISGPDARAFQIVPDLTGLTLPTGGRRDFTVRFSPSHSGPHSATLTVSDTPSPPFTSWSLPLVGVGVAAEADADAQRLGRFEDVAVGGYWLHPGRLPGGAAGAPALKVTEVKITGPDAAAFAFDPGLKGATVPPGAARDFWIRFKAAHPGQHTATLVISRSPSPPFSPWRIPLSGNGLDIPVDCGTVAIGASGEGRQVMYGGTWDGILLKVGRIAITGPDARAFHMAADLTGVALPTGERRDVRIQFTPTHAGRHSATLNIYQVPSPPWTSYTLPLTGTGLAAPPPPASDQAEGAPGSFPDLPVGAYWIHTPEAKATAGPLTIPSVTVTGPDAAAFQVDPELKWTAVAAGGARRFWIRFTARHLGKHSATLVVSESPSPAYSSWTIPLSGNGIEKQIDCGRTALGTSSVGRQSMAGGAWNGVPMKVARITISGPDARAFQVTPDLGGLTLPTGSTHELAIRFTPVRPGIHKATVEIANTPSPPFATWTLPLQGIGIDESAVARPFAPVQPTSMTPAPSAPAAPPAGRSPLLPIALIGGGGAAVIGLAALLKMRKAPMPRSEIVALGTAITKADSCANEGRVADGLALLVSGLRRAEQERRRGSRWAGEAVSRWRSVMDEYATEHRLGPAAEIAPAEGEGSNGGAGHRDYAGG